jgi:hypothetical protein
MPDRYGENSEPLADWERELLHANAIANCDLCDDKGMRGMFLCDHVDRAEIYKRGMEMVRAAMGWKSYCQRCGIPHAGNCKREENR